MSLVDALFRKRRSAVIPRRLGLRLERLEVRRALAADDGSDPWEGFVPDDGSGTVDGWVDGWFDPNDPAWCDPGDVIAFSLPPTGDDGAGTDGGDRASGDGDPDTWIDPLPVCWLPLVDENGNPLPQPFWRTGEGGGDGDAGVGDEGGSDFGFTPPPDDAIVTMALVGYRNVVTGEVFIARSGGWTAPSDDWVIDPSVVDLVFGGTVGPGGDESGVDGGTDGGTDDPGSFWGDDVWFDAVGWGTIDGVDWVYDFAGPTDWTGPAFDADGNPLPVAGAGPSAQAVQRPQWSALNVGFFARVSELADASETPPVCLDVAVEPQDDGSVTVTWSDLPPEADDPAGGHVVQYRRLRDTEWTTYPSAPLDDGSGEIDGLVEGANYVFRTAVVTPTGIGAVSTASRAFTYEGPGSRPTDVVATNGADGVVVTWHDPFANSGYGGPAIDGYVVEARRLRDSDWSAVGSVTGATSLTVTGLDGGAHYVFRVTKTNLGMLQVVGSPSRPSAPLTTSAGATIAVEQTAAGGARISWDTAGAGDGEQIVEFRRLAATEWVRAGSFPAASGVATIDGLPGGRHYTFRILSAGGIYSPRSRAVTLPEQVDYLLRATADAGGAVITWTDPLAATRTETVVEYRRLRDSAWSELGSVASDAGTVGLAGLVPNANYVFRLRQRDADGLLSRTVATRPVTVQPRLPDCWLPPPAPRTFDGSTLMLVNPDDGLAPTSIHIPESTTDGSASGATGTLLATGEFVGTCPINTSLLVGDDESSSGDVAAG